MFVLFLGFTLVNGVEAAEFPIPHIPTPHQLMCDFYNDTAVEHKFEHVICGRYNSTRVQKLCNFTFAHFWNHLASDDYCPGFPAPWEPFKPLHNAMHKLFCFGLNHEKDEYPKIEKEVCNSSYRLKTWACDKVLNTTWNHWLTGCNMTVPPTEVEAEELPTPKDLMCHLYNDTSIEHKFEHALCGHFNHTREEELCNYTFTHYWSHLASEDNCPGFPAPWQPLKPVEAELHKLFCYGLNREKDQFPRIEQEVCNSSTRVKTWVCDKGLNAVWDHWLTGCNMTVPPTELLVI